MPRGGKREGAGRPVGRSSVPREKALSVQIAVRITPGEREELERRAAACGTTLSRYVHELLFPQTEAL